MKPHPQTIAFTSLAAIGLLGLGAWLSQGPRAADAPAQPKPALTVSVVGVQAQRLPLNLSANGSISAWQEASVGTEANGLRLAEVRVNVGDRVSAGQVLARFADEPVQADLAQVRAALSEAQATLAEAQANAERARSLQASGALSAQQINQYLTAELTARARVESAQASVQSQQLRLRQTLVLAPDAGIVSARSATVGAVLPAGTELFRLIRQSRLEWRAEVVAAELGRIQPGQSVKVQGPGPQAVTGKVRMLAPTVDPQTRTALVYVDLPTAAAAQAQLRAGMFARGDFELGATDALTIPAAAVVLRDGFSYVFALQPDNRVRQLKVLTARRQGNSVEITEGLPPDAQVVAQGAAFLNDRDLVKVVAAPAAATNAATK